MDPSFQQATLGGVTHGFAVRGPPRAPVVLLVQAGPGFPMLQEARTLERALRLEGRARVVYWDQRGTGRSLDPSPAPLTGEALVEDVKAMAELLCRRLEVSALAAVGFSLGGTLAALASRRTAAIDRLVLVGPDVDFAAAERFAWDFAREEARRRGHRRALAALEALGPPPHDTAEKFMARVRWVTDLGGIHRGRSFAGVAARLALSLLGSPFYSLPQALAALRAMPATQARALPALPALGLPARLEVPVTLVQGRLDAAAPPALAARWFEALDAPAGKRLHWLERSAHTPHLEEPEAFRALLAEALGLEPLPGVAAPGRGGSGQSSSPASSSSPAAPASSGTAASRGRQVQGS